jgi:hypothetical protein
MIYENIPSGLSDNCLKEALVTNIELAKLDKKLEQFHYCINNSKVYDDDGNFEPYSTVISTLQEHIAYCSSKKNIK